MVTVVNSVSEFETILQNNEKVVVDFFATWCMPCKMMGPVVDEVSVERKDLFVAKVDVDKLPELAQKYNVYSIPHVEVFAGGQARGNIVGYHDKVQLIRDIDGYLK